MDLQGLNFQSFLASNCLHFHAWMGGIISMLDGSFVYKIVLFLSKLSRGDSILKYGFVASSCTYNISYFSFLYTINTVNIYWSLLPLFTLPRIQACEGD